RADRSRAGLLAALDQLVAQRTKSGEGGVGVGADPARRSGGVNLRFAMILAAAAVGPFGTAHVRFAATLAIPVAIAVTRPIAAGPVFAAAVTVPVAARAITAFGALAGGRLLGLAGLGLGGRIAVGLRRAAIGVAAATLSASGLVAMLAARVAT